MDRWCEGVREKTTIGKARVQGVITGRSSHAFKPRFDGKQVSTWDRKGPLREYYRMDAPIRSNRFEPKIETLVYPAVQALIQGSVSSGKQVITFQEFEGPLGVPDFVSVTNIREDIIYRDYSRLPIVRNRADALLLGTVPIGRTVTETTIARNLGVDVKLVAQKVTRLVGTGHLQRYGSGVRRHPLIEPLGRISAYEAKVNDWSSAISQAFRYSLWSDVSTACMLQLPNSNDAAINLARNFGVGLAHKERWLIKPKQSKKNHGLRLFASELLLQMMHSGNE